MSQVNDYLLRCAREICGVALVEHARRTHLEITSTANADVCVNVEVTPLDDTAEAKISGRTAAGDLREFSVSNRDWQRLAELIVDALPAELLAEESVSVRLTGEYADGTTVRPAHGDSASDSLISEQPQPTEPVVRSIERGVDSLLDVAVSTALDFVASERGSAQVCVNGKSFPTWVSIDRMVRDSGVSFYAQTNDMDLMVGIPPTLNVSAADPAELKEAIIAYLKEQFAGVQHITVKVFRRPRSGYEPILEGNSEFGTFGKKIEPIIGC
jgi:hypothetical protein